MRMSISPGPSRCRKLLGAKAALLYKWIRNHQNASFNRANFTANSKNLEKSISKLAVLKSCSKQQGHSRAPRYTHLLRSPLPLLHLLSQHRSLHQARLTCSPLCFHDVSVTVRAKKRLSQPLSLKHSHNSQLIMVELSMCTMSYWKL